MTRESSIDSILSEALELPEDRRAAFVERACGHDLNLRHKVADLIAALQRNPDFLAAPTAEIASVRDRSDRSSTGAALGSVKPDVPLGGHIGVYRTLELIGEGGFGVVFLAEQEKPVRRRVALKIIKLGMDTRSVVARFEQERQALALMDHPNIAKVLDAGATDSGRPYFVMEYVKGVPITRFCAENNVPLRDRLTLFADVCHAVQHAHQKGVIHRDLKPSNVLVSRYDDKPVVKIIDFGIAKAISGRLTDKTLYTEVRQLIGTPAYMSPEQAGLSDLDVDTRSDIYSLGVLLYELLTGTTPFEPERLRSVDFDELRRIIREEEPPKPSTRASSLTPSHSGAQRRGVFADGEGRGEGSSLVQASLPTRHVDLKSLSRALRGDLDWIVMKCLEKDRQRRYETANALAVDLASYLAGAVVSAVPPSAGYRVSKLLCRHRGVVAACALILAALIVGIIGTTWQAREATAQRNRSENAHDKALRVQHMLERLLSFSQPMRNIYEAGAAHTALKPDVRLIDALDEALPDLEAQFDGQPEVEADVRYTLGKSYFGLSRFSEASRQLERALMLYQQLLGDTDPRTLDCLNVLGYSCWWNGAPQRAEWAFRAAVAGFERRGNPLDPDAISALAGLAMFLRDNGYQPEALNLARLVLARRRQTARPDSREVYLAKATLAAVLSAGEVYVPEADQLSREALSQCLNAEPSHSPVDEWFCRVIAVDCALAAKRSTEAIEHGQALVRLADGIAGPVTFMGTLSRTRLGLALMGAQRWAEASVVLRESYAAQAIVFGPTHQLTMETLLETAGADYEQWRIDAGRSEFPRQAAEAAEEVLVWLVHDTSTSDWWSQSAFYSAMRIYQRIDVPRDEICDETSGAWRDELAAWWAAYSSTNPTPDPRPPP